MMPRGSWPLTYNQPVEECCVHGKCEEETIAEGRWEQLRGERYQPLARKEEQESLDSLLILSMYVHI